MQSSICILPLDNCNYINYIRDDQSSILEYTALGITLNSRTPQKLLLGASPLIWTSVMLLQQKFYVNATSLSQATPLCNLMS